ncbi:MAG: hypothetical protein ACRDMZ_00475, partial [Solirubrobacteraceae bacterium]
MTRRTIALVCVWTLPSLVFLTTAAVSYNAFRIPPPDRLDPAERAAVMAAARAGLAEAGPSGSAASASSGGAPSASPRLKRELAGPLAVTAWFGGRAFARVTASGDDLVAAAAAAARPLSEQPALHNLGASDRAAMRLQVDIVTGTGPLGGRSEWFDALTVPGVGDMLAINPGIEGVAADLDGKPVLLLPHELVMARLLAARRPSSVFPDFAMSADIDTIAQLLVARAGAPRTSEPRGLVRLRTDTFVEAPDHAAPPLALYRGIPSAPRLSA